MSEASVDLYYAEPSLRPREEGQGPRRRTLGNAPVAPVRRAPGRAETSPRPPAVEIAFLAKYGVPLDVLHYATTLARRQGVSADAALLAEGLVADEVFYRALADHLGVPFLEAGIELPLGAAVGAERGYVPLRGESDGPRWLFAPVGAEIFRLMSVVRAARGRALFALTTRTRFIEALRDALAGEVARAASLSVERVDPRLCVRRSLRRGSLAVATVLLCTAIACLFTPWAGPRLLAALLLAGAFLAGIVLRLCASWSSIRASDREVAIEEAQLPVYTVVIALYREAAVARQLSRAIDRLDYPRAKLDVKFVVEHDDEETLAALRSYPPRTPHEIVVAPPGAPRTKPRALNIAMPFARGSLVAVFDAEDLPDARQLRRAAAHFHHAPPELACLQASLVIDNGGLNWMTRLFALEYAALFDVFNKGLAARRLPLFLGGTSNHFRLAAVREIGFWDAYNVTEDADLGLRLLRAGYELRMFDSHTFEEAPATFRALVKQRARWLKGWMQTALVHCRHPARFFADLGPRGAFAVLAMFASGIMGPLFGPLLTARLLYDALFGALLAPRTGFETACSALWCFVAVSGLVSLLAPLLLGARRRGLFGFCGALFYLPLWLLMLSLACWRAFFDLWRRPFHWEKTEHGLTLRGKSDDFGEDEPPFEALGARGIDAAVFPSDPLGTPFWWTETPPDDGARRAEPRLTEPPA
jgi:cellulose synthase/poly-beta-1,6-N-acetylglucosamine synthase-like glycosyltransferase